MDCTYNPPGRFSVFAITSVLPREEINKEAKTYKNFLNEDGTPKSRNRHLIVGKYTLGYHKDKIKDDGVKEKLWQVRKQIKTADPTLKEEYTKRRITYWNQSNQCVYSIQPGSRSFWLGVTDGKEATGHKKRIESNKTLLKITKTDKLENIISLIQ